MKSPQDAFNFKCVHLIIIKYSWSQKPEKASSTEVVVNLVVRTPKELSIIHLTLFVQESGTSNSLSQTDNEMSGWWQVNSVFFSKHLFPRGTSWEWMSRYGTHCSASHSLSSFRLKMQETVPLWHNGTQPGCIQKGKIPLFSWKILKVLCLDRNANRKAGSQPSRRLCLFSSNDAGGILNRAFKQGKSIKLSAVAKCWESAVHISPV